MTSRVRRFLIAMVLFATAIFGSAEANEERAVAPASSVLITGSNRGIGLALANAYAVAGWHVIASCRDPEHASELKALAAKRPNVAIETLDVVSKPSLDALAAKYRGQPIDVLINNAGIAGAYEGQLPGHFDEAVFQEVMRVNALAPLWVSSTFLENVKARHQRKIIAISSARGSVAKPFLDHRSYFYDMSKGALNLAMRKFQSDVVDTGILIGVFTPGPVDTDLNRDARSGLPAGLALVTPAESAAALLALIDHLSAANQLPKLQGGGARLVRCHSCLRGQGSELREPPFLIDG
jgi:NAD(P)-dependent dehydrogenase (short-subunit alcohol dehydrogenase family)